MFALVGTAYGGDGVKTFGLPNFQLRIPIGKEDDQPLGILGGTPSVKLLSSQLPAHLHIDSHSVKQKCNNSGGTPSNSAQNNFPATLSSSGATVYNNTDSQGAYTQAFDGTVSQLVVGGNQPHNNMPKYITINYIICYEGVWPQRK